MKYNIFNSMMWKSKINYPNKNQLIKIIQKNYEKNPNQTPKGWKCMLHSSFKTKDNQIPNDLLEIVENKSNEFLDICEKELGMKGEYYISDIWYNAYGANQFQEPHTHGGALFSGCYYLKFNKQFHHQTTFYNPNYNLNYSKLENNSYFCFTPDCEEDDLIIFPSHLKHGTRGIVNKNCKDIRITISFNIINSSMCCERKDNDIIKYS